jgi:hypothetical protein
MLHQVPLFALALCRLEWVRQRNIAAHLVTLHLELSGVLYGAAEVVDYSVQLDIRRVVVVWHPRRLYAQMVAHGFVHGGELEVALRTPAVVHIEAAEIEVVGFAYRCDLAAHSGGTHSGGNGMRLELRLGGTYSLVAYCHFGAAPGFEVTPAFGAVPDVEVVLGLQLVDTAEWVCSDPMFRKAVKENMRIGVLYVEWTLLAKSNGHNRKLTLLPYGFHWLV